MKTGTAMLPEVQRFEDAYANAETEFLAGYSYEESSVAYRARHAKWTSAKNEAWEELGKTTTHPIVSWIVKTIGPNSEYLQEARIILQELNEDSTLQDIDEIAARHHWCDGIYRDTFRERALQEGVFGNTKRVLKAKVDYGPWGEYVSGVLPIETEKLIELFDSDKVNCVKFYLEEEDTEVKLRMVYTIDE